MIQKRFILTGNFVFQIFYNYFFKKNLKDRNFF